MCGIIGFLSNKQRINITAFNEMRDTLIHRGPDGAGTETFLNEHVALGHRRLSIIDLSEIANQPMSNEDNSIWLTYNGEIYNNQLLKKELEQKGHFFKSSTDSEVLIHGYEEWGISTLLTRLKGMFAFAIWDNNSKKLYAARDRFGIKPFYYYKDDNQLIFASEIKAIVKNKSVDTSIDFTSVADFLVYRFIPAPKSIYKKIYKLMPAEFLEYDYNNHSIHTKSYWSLIAKENKETDYNEILIKTQKLINDSIKEHLMSDVPLGVFLSGGYDSSTIVHFMNKLGYPVQTYTIGFKDWPKSEHKHAKMIADIFQTQHHEKILPKNLGEDLSKIMYHYDEPLGGSSFMPTFEISNFASRDATVLLGGDGGDEVFAGYNWHYRLMRTNNSIRSRIKNLLYKKDFLLEGYFKQMNWSGFSYQEMHSLFNDNLNNSYNPSNLWLYKQYDQPELSDIKRLQRLDLKTFLPEVICQKVDRASMAHSIEVRVPFLDHDLVEYVYSLNPKHYYKQGIKKKLLFDIIKDHLPKEILEKRKQGFGAPINKENNFSSKVQNGVLIKKGIINGEMVQRYIDQGERGKMWALYILENWFQCWKA